MEFGQKITFWSKFPNSLWNSAKIAMKPSNLGNYNFFWILCIHWLIIIWIIFCYNITRASIVITCGVMVCVNAVLRASWTTMVVQLTHSTLFWNWGNWYYAFYTYYAPLSSDVFLASKRRNRVKYSLVGVDNLKVTQVLCKECSALYIQLNPLIFCLLEVLENNI